jgi:septal ring factor EnvC (AmiA/AmiB activator)
VPWWTWLCFGIFLSAVIATAVFCAFAFGRLKRLGAAAEGIQARLDEVARLSEETQGRQAHLQERLEELERHRARTEASIARLKVLTTAFSEATGGVLGARRRYLTK